MKGYILSNLPKLTKGKLEVTVADVTFEVEAVDVAFDNEPGRGTTARITLRTKETITINGVFYNVDIDQASNTLTGITLTNTLPPENLE